MSDIKIPKGQELLLSIKNLHETRKLRPSDPRLKVPTAKRRVGRRRSRRGWRFFDPLWIRNPATRKYHTPPEMIHEYVDLLPIGCEHGIHKQARGAPYTQGVEAIRNYVVANKEYILNNAFELTPTVLRPMRFGAFVTPTSVGGSLGREPLQRVATYAEGDGWIFNDNISDIIGFDRFTLAFYGLFERIERPGEYYDFDALIATFDLRNPDSPNYWKKGGDYICSAVPLFWDALTTDGIPIDVLSWLMIYWTIRPTVLPCPPREFLYDPESIYWNMSVEEFLTAIEGLYLLKLQELHRDLDEDRCRATVSTEPVTVRPGRHGWEEIRLKNILDTVLNPRMIFRDGELVYSSLTLPFPY